LHVVDFVDTLQTDINRLLFYKMKIYVNARFLTQPITGVQRYGIECSRQIKKLHPEVTFLTPENILSKDIATELEVEIIGKNTGHRWEQTDLPRYLKKIGNPKLLNFANTAPLLYNNNYTTIHDLAFHFHPEWNSRLFATWYNFLIPKIAKKSKHIFTVSNTIKDEIITAYYIQPDKISVTFNGISKKLTEYINGNIPTKKKIILSVGTFSIRKNHQNVIKGFLQSNIKDEYKLALVGDRNKIFSESGIDNELLKNSNIDLLQHLTETELIELYCSSEIVVSLSKYEGFGIPLLEGLYAGCKLLCSDIPVYKELYTGFATFCQQDNIENISEAMNKIVSFDRNIEPLKMQKLFGVCNYKKAAETILEKVLSVA